jgi:succinylglutamate desuccinylase/N-acetylglutamate synthase-like GNAT family acetyltransferase
MAIRLAIRSATSADLPSIHNLIQQSFDAMVDHYGEDARQRMQSQAEDLINKAFTEEAFHSQYFSSQDSHFWVATSAEDSTEGEVLGCVGLQKVNSEEGELVRMAVNTFIRNSGIGSKLIQKLIDHCMESKIKRIFLTTGNPNSAKFYAKHAFMSTRFFSFPLSPSITFSGVRMTRYLSEKLIRRVAVVGGTHGNERIGVELIRQWTANNQALQRSTITTIPVIGNPAAVLLNQRYVSEDLNRQFTGGSKASFALSTNAVSEHHTAQTLDRILGPKLKSSSVPTGVDFTIDLHSSTSNTGLVVMVSALEHDLHALRLVNYLQKHVPELKVASSIGKKDDSCYVDSISPSGISFEVGPLPHGCLSHSLLNDTHRLVQLTLDYFDERNQVVLNEAKLSIEASNGVGVKNFDQVLTSVTECDELKEVSLSLCPTAIIPQTADFQIISRLISLPSRAKSPIFVPIIYTAFFS